MKSILIFIFIGSFATALFLGFENFFVPTANVAVESPFEKNSLQDKIYADFVDLKTKKQLPSQLFDVSGFFVSDQRADRRIKLHREIISAIKMIAPPKGDGLYEVEMVIFDTIQNQKSFPKMNSKDKIDLNAANSESNEKNELVFQISIIEKKTKNKVAEIGRTYAPN